MESELVQVANLQTIRKKQSPFTLKPVYWKDTATMDFANSFTKPLKHKHMILSHTIQFRNNNLNIVVDYDPDNRSVEFFNYATITDDKGEVDISDMFTSYLNGEEIMDNINWHKIYNEIQNEKNIDYEKDI